MGKELTAEYDKVGDILYLDVAPSTEDHVMIEVAPGALLRQNTLTGAIDGIEIHGFTRRAADGHGVTLPVGIDLRASQPVVS